ncbi:MAG: hypothetical protein AAGK05_11845, partial [Pseudomonadota bacterium]
MNSWILYRIQENGKCDLNKFRTAAAESLLAENRVEKRTVLMKDDRCDGMNHMIAFKENKQNRCRQCKKKTHLLNAKNVKYFS